MNQILKYPLEIKDDVEIEMTKYSSIVDIQYKNGHPHIWALTDPASFEKFIYKFKIFGTGMIFDLPNDYAFVKTIHNDITGYVWHIFVKDEPQ